jgi:nitrogen fixation NifU-like protein
LDIGALLTLNQNPQLTSETWRIRVKLLAMYSPQLLAQFENQRYVGDLPDADVSVQVENPACGDILRLSLRFEGDRITDARFRARGCVAAIACGSQLCALLVGKSAAEARALTPKDIVSALAGLPEASTHASHLAIDALKAALSQSAASAA